MTTHTIDALDELLAETADSASERARTAFDAAAGDRPIVVYGAGEAGQTVASVLTDAGRPPLGFADRSAQPGQKINGLEVLEPTAAIKRWGKDAAYVIGIVNPSVKTSDVIDDLTQLGCECVVPYVELGWKYPDALLPRFAVGLPTGPLEAADDVRAAFALLGDDVSRAEFLDQIRWRISGDIGANAAAHASFTSHYFPEDLFTIREDEVFIDVGAYDGDTVEEFLEVSGGKFERLVALEPDPPNLAALEATVAALDPGLSDRIDVHAIAAADKPGTLRFGLSGTTSAMAMEDGEVEVEAARLDDLVAELNPTYVKYDIEGAEPDALIGTQAIVDSERPILAVCVYHLPDHLWNLPLQVANMVGEGYRFYLRRYATDFFEEVLYAVPQERALKQ